MRFARKLFLLAITAVAAMAMAATTANAAETPIEAIEETPSTHCPAVMLVGHVVSGGCHLDATSTSDITLEASFGTSRCSNSYEASFDENGQGYVYNQVFGPPSSGTGCITEPCVEASGAKEPWRVMSAGERGTTGHLEHMIIEFCVTSHVFFEGSKSHCELEVNFSEEASPDPHDHGDFEAAQSVCHQNTNHVTGTWEAFKEVGESGVHIAHLG